MSHIQRLSTPVSSQAAMVTPGIATPRLNLGLRVGWLSVLAAGLVAMFLLNLVVGSVNIPLDDIVRVLLGGEASKDTWTNIILKIRLPEALTAMLAGAALSVSGLMMQTFFRNALADPYVLGISSGASMGVALVVMGVGSAGGTLLAGIGLTGDLLITAAAAAGASVTLLIVLVVARRIQNNAMLLIIGLMFGYFTGSLVSMLLYFTITERIQVFVNWSFGTFSGVTWGQMPVFIPPIVAGLTLALLLAKSLNALLPGETYARSMGLNIGRARLAIILATALLAGTVTAFCGPVGFIGIAVPHLCRGLFRTSDHRNLIPATILLGGIAALVAALMAELPGSNIVLPLNAVTALMGAPVVLWVLLRQKKF